MCNVLFFSRVLFYPTKHNTRHLDRAAAKVYTLSVVSGAMFSPPSQQQPHDVKIMCTQHVHQFRPNVTCKKLHKQKTDRLWKPATTTLVQAQRATVP